jgi:hypothetical protein
LIRLGADEDLDNHVVRGLRHRLPTVDFVRVQDVGLINAPDQEVLAWAADAGRVLVSHDASTMTAAAYSRIESRMPMPGVIIVPQWVPIGRVIEDLLMVVECSAASDWEDQVRFLPL